MAIAPPFEKPTTVTWSGGTPASSSCRTSPATFCA